MTPPDDKPARKKTGRPPGNAAAIAAQVADRRVQVWALRRGGASYRQIGESVGVSKDQVRSDLRVIIDELQDREVELATEYLHTNLERCEAMLMRQYTRAVEGDPRAIDAVLRIIQMESRMLGLEQAINIDARTHVGDVNVLQVAEDAREKLLARLNRTIEGYEALPPSTNGTNGSHP